MADSRLQRPKWLLEVGKKLNPEGKLLLKLLYCKTLPHRILVDGVIEPKDLYEQSLKLQLFSETDLEFAVLSPDDALAIFIHRLSILVPVLGTDPTSRPRNSLGAQECLDNLTKCGIPQPPLQVVFSQESKLLECLVKAYVNMSQRKRDKLRVQLGKQVGIHHQNQDIFQVLCEIFQMQNGKSVEIVDEFVRALGNTRAPQAIIDDLERNLGNNEIHHNPFPKNVASDYSDDEYDENDRLLKEVVALKDSRDRPVRCPRRIAAYCGISCIPIFLAILAIGASTGYISGQNRSTHSQHHFEDLSNNQTHCPKYSALIRLGTVNSFWYSGVKIYQEDTHSVLNTWEYVSFYAVPSKSVKVRKEQYSCKSNKSGSVWLIFPVYLLKGSNLKFNICIQSTAQNRRGNINVTIFNNFTYYMKFFKNCNSNYIIKQHRIYVDANQSNCSNYSFTATHDSYYYVESGSCPYHALMTYYRVDYNVNFLSPSDLSGTPASCNSTKDTHSNCYVPIGNGNHWLSSQDYEIIASIAPSPDLSHSGNLRIRSVFRDAVYLIPAIAGGIFFIPMFIVCAAASCFVYRRGGRKTEAEEEF